MDYRKQFVVDPADRLRLPKVDPGYKGHHELEEMAKQETEHYREKLAHQQALLYAERKHSVLVVLQALDARGKDGTVKHVFSALNPQGTTVTGFKQPTPLEMAHDFLWRVHPHAPGRGEVAIFNRSHYEDVLVTRVHKLIDKPTWIARYERICEFEKGLVDSGTTILKFFLHISKEEQLARFAEVNITKFRDNEIEDISLFHLFYFVVKLKKLKDGANIGRKALNVTDTDSGSLNVANGRWVQVHLARGHALSRRLLLLCTS